MRQPYSKRVSKVRLASYCNCMHLAGTCYLRQLHCCVLHAHTCGNSKAVQRPCTVVSNIMIPSSHATLFAYAGALDAHAPSASNQAPALGARNPFTSAGTNTRSAFASAPVPSPFGVCPDTRISATAPSPFGITPADPGSAAARAPPMTTLSLFGNPNLTFNAAASGLFEGGQPAPASSLFGQAIPTGTAAAPTLFGSSQPGPAAVAAPPSLFGQAGPAPVTLFGATQPAATGTPAPSLFGGSQPAPAAPTLSTAEPSLFGGGAPGAPSLFGGGQHPPAGTPSLFGGGGGGGQPVLPSTVPITDPAGPTPANQAPATTTGADTPPS